MDKRPRFLGIKTKSDTVEVEKKLTKVTEGTGVFVLLTEPFRTSYHAGVLLVVVKAADVVLVTLKGIAVGISKIDEGLQEPDVVP